MKHKLTIILAAAALAFGATAADANVVSGTFAHDASAFTVSGEAGKISFASAVTGSLAHLSLTSSFSVDATGDFDIGHALISSGTLVDDAAALFGGKNTFDATTLSLRGLSVADHAVGSELLLPFSFADNGTTDYGWLEFDVSKSRLDTYSFSLDSYAYADNGEAIRAGTLTAVPEPSQVALMMAGVLGLVGLRRRQQSRG